MLFVKASSEFRNMWQIFRIIKNKKKSIFVEKTNC